MAKSIVTVAGVRTVSSNFKRIMPEFEKLFAAELVKLSKDFVVDAVPRAPILTGDLRSTIRPGKKVEISKNLIRIAIRAGGVKGKVTGRKVTWAAEQHQFGRMPDFILIPALASGFRLLDAAQDAWAKLSTRFRSTGGTL